MPRIAVIALAIFAALLPGTETVAAPKTDVIVLINGDHITGEIKSLERGMLSYSTDFVGTINVEWDKVAQLRSDQLLEVELLDGTRTVGRAAELDERGTMRLLPSNGSPVRSVPLDSTMRIAALDEGRIRDRMDGYISFGWSAAAANDVSQVSLNAGLTYRDEVRLWDFTYEGSRSETETSAPSQSQTLAIEQLRFLRDEWFWTGGGNIASNDELGLDLRVLLEGGFGRYFYQTQHQEFLAALGIGLAHEEFDDGQKQESWEGILLMSYDIYRFDTPEVDISTDLAIYPSLTISGRVRTDASIQMSYEIIDDLFYRLSLHHNYDSEPQSLNATTTDWSLVTSLGYSF
jgi:hypothetical protein